MDFVVLPDCHIMLGAWKARYDFGENRVACRPAAKCALAHPGLSRDHRPGRLMSAAASRRCGAPLLTPIWNRRSRNSRGHRMRYSAALTSGSRLDTRFLLFDVTKPCHHCARDSTLLNLPGGEPRGYNVRTEEIAHAS